MFDEWEYNAARISGGGPNSLIDALNKLGKEGWEAWGRESHPDGDLVFIKRKKPAPIQLPVYQMPGGIRGARPRS